MYVASESMMQQTMAVERGPVLRREKCYCHGCITAATNYVQGKGKRRVLQLKEMLQDDIYLNCRKCCIRTTASPAQKAFLDVAPISFLALFGSFFPWDHGAAVELA